MEDFLPAGVAFDKTKLSSSNQWQASDNLRVYATNQGVPFSGETITLGECSFDLSNPADVTDAYAAFVGGVELSDSDRKLTWKLGSDTCYPNDDPSESQDRFWPGGIDLDIYVKVTVVDVQAFAATDISANLAKYQQMNVDREIFFKRSKAETTLDQSPRLVKGIRYFTDRDGEERSEIPGGNLYGLNIDGGTAVQTDEVTFRLDVMAPYSDQPPYLTGSTGYVLYDALPAGTSKQDLKGFVADPGDPDYGTFTSATAAQVTQTWVPPVPDTNDPNKIADDGDPLPDPEVSVAADLWSAHAYDPGDAGYPDDVRDTYKDRTIVVWVYNGAVPGSILADPTTSAYVPEVPAIPADPGDPDADPPIPPTPEVPAIPAVPAKFAAPMIPQGFTLGYTLTVPDGTGSDAALVGQQYVNDASIVSLKYANNGGGSSTLLMNGSEDGPSVVKPGTADASNDRYTFDDASDQASDDSWFEIETPKTAKRLVSTEIGDTKADINGTVGLTHLDATRNSQSGIVPGEYAVFEYSLTVPEHTSIKGATISDGGQLARSSGTPPSLPYEFVKAEFFGPGNTGDAGHTADVCNNPDLDGLPGFTCADTVAGAGSTVTHGVLTFPATYQNDTDDPQVFRVRVTVWMKDRDNKPTNSSVAQIANNTALTNTATSSYDNANFDSSLPVSSGNPEKLTQTANATATFFEPNPTLTKVVTTPVASGTPPEHVIDINGEATFKLTASNANNRPALYDSVVYDCVPAELGIVTGSAVASSGTTVTIPTSGNDGKCSISGSTITMGSGTGQLIIWKIGQINGTGTSGAPTLTYKAKAKDDVGAGLAIQNVARLDGYTLPSPLNIPVAGNPDDTRDTTMRRGYYTRDAGASVRMVNAAIEKSVETLNGLGKAPVGETVTYTVKTTLPPNANFYDVTLTDSLPAGVEYVATTSATVDWAGATPTPKVISPAGPGGSNPIWTFVDKDDESQQIRDFALHTAPRTIEIVFTAKVTDAVISAAPVNSAAFSWNKVNDQPDTRSTTSDTADFSILNPSLEITKKIDGQDSIGRNPDATFDYTVEVRNTGDTPAHHIAVEDVVPEGVIVSNISPVPASVDPGVATGAGGKITWEFNGSLAVFTDGVAINERLSISYSGKFSPSAQLDSDDYPYENIVNVKSYESLDQDGWVYTPPVRNPDGTTTPGGTRPGGTPVPAANADADVTPVFPNVALQKQVSSANPATPSTNVAYAGEPFGWTLRATNNGAGDTQSIEILDELPKNWNYDTHADRAPQIRLNGGAWVALEAPAIDSADTRKLSWSNAQIRTALETAGLITVDAPVIAGKVGTNASSYIEIRFSTIPQGGALTDAGATHENADPPATVVRPKHTNTLTAVAKDTRGDTENSAGKYSPGNSPADAFIQSADLKLVKSAIGGTTGTAPAGDPLHGVAADKWVIGADVGAHYTQPQWNITVTNHGPDASYGPFEITDTLNPLTGVTTGSWTARYFAPGGPTEGTALTLTSTGTGTAADPFKLRVGGNSTSLTTAGTDRIVLTADVTIDPATAVPGATAENEASVEGRTYEPDDKKGTEPTNPNPNTDDAARDLSESADLAVVKSVAPTTVNAGESISWTITPYNHGPSVSRNSASSPITISDAIPPGVVDVGYPFADPATANWTVTLNGATWDPTADPAVKADAGDSIVFTLKPSTASMAVGSHTPITLSGTVRADWAPTSTSPSGNDGRIVNTATITPRITSDPATPNNTDDAEPTMTFDTDLQISKTRVKWDATGGTGGTGAWVPDTDAVQAGARVSYLIEVSNNGSAVARSVQVTDQAPSPELSYVSYENISPANWGAPVAHGTNANWQVFTLGSELPVGEMRSFVATYDSQPLAPDNVTNCAAVASASNALTDTDCATFGSDRVADLAISKRVIDGAGGAVVDPDSGATTTAGSAVWYRLVVTNRGPSNAVGPIKVEDTLPENFSYVAGSATVGGAASAPTVSTDASGKKSVLTWANVLPTGQILVDGTIVVEFQVTVAPDHLPATGIVNSAEVESDFDNNPSNDSSTTPIDITRLAEMQITKAVSNPAVAPWLAGSDVEYTLTIVNDGPSAAPARVVDTLPAGLTLKSWTGADWACTGTVGGQSLSCDFDSSTDTDPGTGLLHPVGKAAATEITVVSHIDSNLPTTTLANPFVNTAVLTWTDSRQYTDPTQDPRQDEDDASITVTTQADLGIVKTAVDPDDNVTQVTSAVAGEQARYRLDVTNYGPSDAAPSLVVTDTLPIGVAYVAPAGATSIDWQISTSAYDPAVPQTVTFTRVSGGDPSGLPMVGTSATTAPAIIFDVLLSSELAPTDPPTVPAILNVATVTSGTPEPAVDPHPNTDDAAMSVVRSADLEIKKSHPVADDRDRVFVGDPLDFTIDVTNHGPSISSGFTVTDTVPVGFEVTAVDGVTDFAALPGQSAGSNWRVDSVTLVTDPVAADFGKTLVVATYLGELGINDGVDNSADSLIISTMPNEDAFSESDEVVNYVEITDANEPDPVDPNNEFTDPIKVRPVVTLVLEKTAVGEFKVGKTGLYSITLENLGPHTDHGPITVADQLPAGLSFNGSPKLPEGATVTHDKGLVTWTLTEPLGVDEQVELLLVVNVLQAAYDQPDHTVVNEAIVDTESGKSDDPRWQPTDDATVKVKPADPLVVTGGELAGGMLAAFALLLLLGGGTYIAGRKRQRTRHG